MDAPTSGFRLEEFMPYELSIAANRTSLLFARRYSQAFGLSIPEWRVMAVVGRFGTLSSGAIAERTEMDKVKVSRAVSSLTASGLVSQAPDPQDGRARLVRLTRKGSTVHAAIVPRAQQFEVLLAAGFSAAEWAALRTALRKLYAHVRELE